MSKSNPLKYIALSHLLNSESNATPIPDTFKVRFERNDANRLTGIRHLPNWRKAVNQLPDDGTPCLVWARYPGDYRIAVYRANAIEKWDGCFSWAPDEWVPLSELR